MRKRVLELAAQLQEEHGHPWPVALGEAVSQLSRERYIHNDEGDFAPLTEETEDE